MEIAVEQRLILTQVIDWHMKFDDKPIWEEPND